MWLYRGLTDKSTREVVEWLVPANRGTDPEARVGGFRTALRIGDTDQARYLEALVSTPAGAIRVASIYLPNGNPMGSEKFPYKIAWMKRQGAADQRPILKVVRPQPEEKISAAI